MPALHLVAYEVALTTRDVVDSADHTVNLAFENGVVNSTAKGLRRVVMLNGELAANTLSVPQQSL